MKNTKYRGKMFDVNINAIKRTKNGRLDNIKEARMKEREREAPENLALLVRSF